MLRHNLERQFAPTYLVEIIVIGSLCVCLYKVLLMSINLREIVSAHSVGKSSLLLVTWRRVPTCVGIMSRVVDNTVSPTI